jgi:hypothetical protein
MQSTRRQRRDVWEEKEDMTLKIKRKITIQRKSKIRSIKKKANQHRRNHFQCNCNLCSSSAERPQFETSRDTRDVIRCNVPDSICTPHWPAAYCWFKNSHNQSINVHVILPSDPSTPAHKCVIGLFRILSCRNS